MYFVCVYMPCDSNDVDSIRDYDNVLSEIPSLCSQHNADHIYIVGDMNTNISRSHYRHTRLLLQFVENNHLYLTLNFSDKMSMSNTHTIIIIIICIHLLIISLYLNVYSI